MIVSPALRDLLVAHIDGPVTFRAVVRQPAVMQQAIANRLLCYDSPRSSRTRPRETTLTEAGRRALAGALAEWAEALITAQRHDKLLRSLLADVTGKVAEAKHLDEVG